MAILDRIKGIGRRPQQLPLCPTCGMALVIPPPPPRQNIRRLTAEEATTIRLYVAAGYSKGAMARKYGVAHNTIRRLISRETYKELP